MEGPTIGILSPLVAGYYYGALISAVNQAVSATGGRVVVVSTAAFSSGYHREMVIEDLPHLGWERIDGFITIANAVSLDYLEALRAAGKGVLALGHEEPGFSYPAVLPDNRGGIKQALQHLVEHGHTRIAFAGSLQHFDVRERYAAYCDGLRANGIQPDPSLLYDIEDNHEFAGRDAGRRMLAAGLPSTAVVAATDLNAAGIMSTLKEAGHLLPADQAITGFDGLPGNASLSPALSSISQHLEEMGNQAARLVMRMAAGETVAPGHYVVHGSFVARESCGCAGGHLVADLDDENERSDAYYELRKAIRDEHEISLDLLRSHESDPRSLGWLTRTKAVAGMLALWRHSPEGGGMGPGTGRAGARGELDLREVTVEEPISHPEAGEVAGRDDDDDGSGHGIVGGAAAPLAAADHASELEVVGTYESRGPGLPAASGLYPAESFPPAALLSSAGVDNIVMLFAVTSEERDWGILSLVVPLDSGFLGQDTYFQWEALLCEALDYQDVLQSLRERSRQLHERGEQLALSYRREREMARAVRESEERYALAARAANDGMWDWDLDAGTVYYSSRWAEMLGYHNDAIGNRPEEWLERVHPEDRASLAAELAALKLGDQASVLCEHRVRTAQGSFIWVLCRGLAVPGVGRPATRIVGSLTDITERRLLEERLRQQALYDALTGLPNRVLFLDRLSQALANSKRRAGSTFTVFWLDLDGFKVLNDSLGHQIGDKLLVQVAERIRAQLRESDTAARFGGDEFAVLLHDVPDLPTVRAVAQRLLNHLGAIYDLDGHEIVVTASVGVAMSATGYERPEDVLRDADIAMYRAKAAGRGIFAIYDSSMHATAMARLRTETELRQAIEPRDQGAVQMELHYQPVVRLGTGEVLGLEALVRWHHPQRGLITPLEFLQVAEDSGLILPMGRWAAAEACRWLVAWESSSLLGPGARVSLNLSNREFWSPKLLDNLDLVLKESGVVPARLAFEITEGVIIDNLEQALVVLQELHARGLQVHVDDFGTGYSSLQALHRLPIDALKIDKSFIAGLVHDDRTAELVRTIVRLGNNLGVTVIAEGIETADQHDRLVEIGCGCGQGYLFSPPVPAASLAGLVAARDLWPGLARDTQGAGKA